MGRQINVKKFLIFLFTFILSIAVSYYVQPFIHNNEKAVDLIVNVFSILAGFLIAVMTIFTELSISSNSSWRRVSLEKKKTERIALQNQLLFYCYLLVLLFVFLSVLFKDTIFRDIKVSALFEYIYLFLACIAFVYSLFLPNNIYRKQKDALDKVLDKEMPKVFQGK